MRIIEWIEKAELRLDRTSKEKKTGGVCRNDFVFNAFLYLEPVQRSENMVRIGENCVATGWHLSYLI